SVIPSAVELASHPVWGRHSDLAGNARIVWLMGFLLPLFPLVWMTAGVLDGVVPITAVLVALQIAATLVWAGFSFCAGNFIYDVAPRENLVRYLAYFSILTSFAGAVGAALGGVLAENLPPLLGHPYRFVFLIAGALLLAVQILFGWTFKEPRTDVQSVGPVRLLLAVVGVWPLRDAGGRRNTFTMLGLVWWIVSQPGRMARRVWSMVRAPQPGRSSKNGLVKKLFGLLAVVLSGFAAFSAPRAPAGPLDDARPSPVQTEEDVFSLLAKFHKHAYFPASGLTGDSIEIETGRLRTFSAASKETLHLFQLALAIRGNPHSMEFVSPGHSDQAFEKSLDLLSRKMQAYHEFAENPDYRGFGGFIPWFDAVPTRVGDQLVERIRPTSGWHDRVPSLDNGEFMWSLYFTYHVLEDAAASRPADPRLAALAADYKAHFQRLAGNAVAMFYDGDGKIRTEARILDPKAAPSAANTADAAPGHDLNDPYEGELMAMMMTLFGNWDDVKEPARAQALPARAHDEPAWRNDSLRRVWLKKREEFKTRSLRVTTGKVTIKEGDVFSAHEAWGLLIAPYKAVPASRFAFEQDERFRTLRAAAAGGGLLGSANIVKETGEVIFRSLGIRDAARLTHEDFEDWTMLTPYAAFPLIHLDRAAGLAWLKRMSVPNVISEKGYLDSARRDGRLAVPVASWETNGLLQLTLSGGVDEPNENHLKRDRKWGEFEALISWQYGVFPGYT
ncbi:MAG: MFS transporter, partial [Elusimicrobia bacterium]|nr:MFS transporter [Elusimicrobiota bacterium]